MLLLCYPPCRLLDGSSREIARPVATALVAHLTEAQKVLEQDDESTENKEDAFEGIKAAAFFLCWLCNTVQAATGATLS